MMSSNRAKYRSKSISASRLPGADRCPLPRFLVHHPPTLAPLAATTLRWKHWIRKPWIRNPGSGTWNPVELRLWIGHGNRHRPHQIRNPPGSGVWPSGPSAPQEDIPYPTPPPYHPSSLILQTLIPHPPSSYKPSSLKPCPSAVWSDRACDGAPRPRQSKSYQDRPALPAAPPPNCCCWLLLPQPISSHPSSLIL